MSRTGIAAIVAVTGAGVFATTSVTPAVSAPDPKRLYVKTDGRSVRGTLGRHCLVVDASGAAKCVEARYPLRTSRRKVTIRPGGTITVRTGAAAGGVSLRIAKVSGAREVVVAKGAATSASRAYTTWRFTIPRKSLRNVKVIGVYVEYRYNQYADFEVGARVSSR